MDKISNLTYSNNIANEVLQKKKTICKNMHIFKPKYSFMSYETSFENVISVVLSVGFGIQYT